MTMNAHAAVSLGSEAARLLALAERCLQESPSRQLDGEIYCAVHYIEDLNSLSMPNLWDAKLNGQVLVRYGQGGAVGWIEAPPFTFERQFAETLLPDGLVTICRDARFVCAAALRSRALTKAPAPALSNVFEFCRG